LPGLIAPVFVHFGLATIQKELKMNTANMSSAMRRLLTARERVARRSEWFGGIIYTARLVERKIGTMATDGTNIYADPDFVRDNDPHIEGVFLHEVLHCALDHPARRKWREHGLWNIACDYAINPLVSKLFTLPKDALISPRFDHMRAEAIYDVLAEERKGRTKPPPGDDEGEPEDKDGPEGQPGKAGGDGQDESQDGETEGEGQDQDHNAADEKSGRMIDPTPEEAEKARAKWQDAVSRTTEKCEKAGNMPSNLKRLINEFTPSEKLDWRKVLDDWARNSRESSNASWSRPNRRWIGQGIIMPGPVDTKIHKLVACIDCSGSVSNEYIKEMKAELHSLLEQKLVSTIHLIATDTDICNEAEVSTVEELADFEVGSGGGTYFEAAMERVAEINDAMGCVFLTDMQTGSFGRDPGMPVMWVDWTRKGDQKVPFGRVCAL
jgi:predicted metal-dependent peptidase